MRPFLIDGTILPGTPNTENVKGDIFTQYNTSFDLSNKCNNINTGNNISSDLLQLAHELLGPRWITDDVIRRYYDAINNSLFPSGDVICMNPTIAHGIKVLNDYTHLIDLLDIQRANYIFIPINDSNSSNEEGSHWSLLIYEKNNAAFYHYDSVKAHNLKMAKLTARKMYDYLLNSQAKDMMFVECPTPQQNNSYDCGVYLIILTEYFGSYIQCHGGLDSSLQRAEPVKLCDIQIITKRSQMAYFILNGPMPKEFIRDIFFYYKTHCMQRKTYMDSNIIPATQNNDGAVNQVNKDTLRQRTYSEEWTTVAANRHPKTNLVPHVRASEVSVTNRYLPLTNHKENENIVQTSTYVVSNKARYKQDVKKQANLKSQCKPKHTNQSGQQNKNVICNTKVQLQKNSNSNFPLSLNIYSDSMGKGLSHILQDISMERNCNIKTFGLCKPGAPLSEVVSDIQVPRKDEKLCNVIIAGANDAAQGKIGPIFKALDECLIRQNNSLNIVATIPTRHDISSYSYYNLKIKEANEYIKEIVSRYPSTYIIDLGKLKRFHFTQFGFHVNGRGKRLVARMILNKVSDTDTSELFDNAPSLKIVESRMVDSIKKHFYDTSTAFAHCISADFHMSAGVAVEFRRLFGRPSMSDCLNHYLAYQKTKQTPAIYSLITKDSYYDKPTAYNYDKAFQMFTDDFKTKGFKRLICSPMGCTRDKIPLNHFAANIARFQKETKANVTIVVYDEPSKRLRNGLSHKEFITQLGSQLQYHQKYSTTGTETLVDDQQLEQTAQSQSLEQLEGQPTSVNGPRLTPGPVTFSDALRNQSEVLTSDMCEIGSFLMQGKAPPIAR